MSVASRIYQKQLDMLLASRSPLEEKERQSFLYYLASEETDAFYRMTASIKPGDTIAGLRDDPALQASYALAASYSDQVKDNASALLDMAERNDEGLQGKIDAFLAEYVALPSDAQRWFSDPVLPAKSILDLPRLLSSPDEDDWPFFIDPERQAFITIFKAKLTKETP